MYHGVTSFFFSSSDSTHRLRYGAIPHVNTGCVHRPASTQKTAERETRRTIWRGPCDPPDKWYSVSLSRNAWS